MPELPDVELFREILVKDALGKTIQRVVVREPRILGNLSPRAFAQRLIGKKLIAVRRYGKHLFARIDGDGWLTFHFGMTGGLQPFTDSHVPPAYDRVHLDFAEDDHLAYINRRMIGHVGWTEDADDFIAEEKLGPDALDRAFTFGRFAKAVTGGRRDAKSVLMDQQVVAGIGNIYSDEILFQARIHPKTSGNSLDKQNLHQLYRAIGTVLKTAIAHHAGAENATQHLPKSFLLPERHKGGHCPRCGCALVTLKSGGRTAYFCPRCQRR